jgi:hypothetical protein
MRRAGNRCEYRQLPIQLQVGGFEIDHILPRSRGGQTTLANVALVGLHCNAHKWAHIDGDVPHRVSGLHCSILGYSGGRSIFSGLCHARLQLWRSPLPGALRPPACR